MIYATTRLEADIRLRAHFFFPSQPRGFLRGKLNQHDGRWLLPISTEPKDGCNRDELIKQSRYCFKAGTVLFNYNFIKDKYKIKRDYFKMKILVD